MRYLVPLLFLSSSFFTVCLCATNFDILKSMASIRVPKDVAKETPHNSIDAMNYHTANALQDVVSKPVRRPVYMNTTPLRALFRSFGLDGPYANQFLRAMSRVEITPVLERLKLGRIVDGYQGLQMNFPEELDVGFCFAEHLFYKARSADMFRSFFPSLRNTRRSRRAPLMEQISSLLEQGANHPVVDNMVTAGISGLVEHLTKQKMNSYSKQASTQNNQVTNEAIPEYNIEQTEYTPMTNWSEVAFAFAKSYLRKYFASLQGGKIKADPEEVEEDLRLVDMVENLGRSFILSTFGVLPGTPASGALPDIIEGRLLPESNLRDAPLPRTGNPLLDFGNSLFDTFQRAGDITNGMYCAKKYIVNHLWVFFRKTARSALGFDILGRDLSWSSGPKPSYFDASNAMSMFRNFITDTPADETEEQKNDRFLRSSSVNKAVQTVRDLYDQLG